MPPDEFAAEFANWFVFSSFIEEQVGGVQRVTNVLPCAGLFHVVLTNLTGGKEGLFDIVEVDGDLLLGAVKLACSRG